MKTIIIISSIFLSLSVFASEPERTLPNNINKHVNALTLYPEQAFNSNIEGFVDVVFSINIDGQIDVVEFFGTDSELVSTVMNHLNKVQMCPMDVSVGKSYKVRYNFNIL